jgi:hypothetical protein
VIPPLLQICRRLQDRHNFRTLRGCLFVFPAPEGEEPRTLLFSLLVGVDIQLVDSVSTTSAQGLLVLQLEQRFFGVKGGDLSLKEFTLPDFRNQVVVYFLEDLLCKCQEELLEGNELSEVISWLPLASYVRLAVQRRYLRFPPLASNTSATRSLLIGCSDMRFCLLIAASFDPKYKTPYFKIR